MQQPQTSLVQLAAGGDEPFTLTEAKQYLRVETDSEDGLITRLISAARARAEMFCRRSFKVGDVYQLTLDRFPSPYPLGFAYRDSPYVEVYGLESAYLLNRPGGFAISLPMGPVTAINAIAYTDGAGVVQALDPAGYELLSGDNAEPRVFPTYGNYWPATRFQPDAVKLTFTAGAAVAPDVLVAMQQMMATWYTTRESIATSGTPQKIPGFAEALLWPYRLLEF